MRICLAQAKPVKGDIASNIRRHLHFIELAIRKTADMIVFPELSITGYEPELAAALATVADDQRFNEFQQLSDAHTISIALGVPTKNDSGIQISQLIFQPGQERQLYSKKYLHPDEEPFFIIGENFPVLAGTIPLIALAICYELSVPEHIALAAANGAAIYIASVAKTATGINSAGETLAAIAARHAIPVLLVNCTGPCDNFISAGRTAVWNSDGDVLAQLDSDHEGILLFDSNTGEVLTENTQID